MAQHLSIDIPVYCYIKKFLHNNSFLKRPYKLTVEDPIGIFITHLLEPAPKYYRPIRKAGMPDGPPLYIGTKGGNKRAEIITVNIAGYTNDGGNQHIPKEKVLHLNKLIDYFIHYEMYTYIESRSHTQYEVETTKTTVNIGGQQLKVTKIRREKKYMVDTLIRDFIAKYDFNEDELTFSALKKWYFRFKKKQQSIE